MKDSALVDQRASHAFKVRDIAGNLGPLPAISRMTRRIASWPLSSE
jgi:hypothetical protein